MGLHGLLEGYLYLFTLLYNEFERIWKEEILTLFEELSGHLCGETEERQ
jgi:hypothetical protein